MDFFQAAILGLVQGLTEFIPVSSSAHLIIIPWLCHWPDPGLAFDAALHLGTLAAVLLYFRRDWVELGRAFAGSLVEGRIAPRQDRILAWLIILGTVPGGVAGVLFEKTVERAFHAPDAPHAAGAMIILAALIAALGILMAVAEKAAQHKRPMNSIGLRDGVLIGLAQACAIFPGVSRSGATITTGLFLGLEREAAARFSFLLACPLIAGAGLKKVYDIFKHHELPTGETGALIVGVLFAAVSGYLCIAFLLRYLQRHSTMVFVWYRLALAAALAAVALLR